MAQLERRHHRRLDAKLDAIKDTTQDSIVALRNELHAGIVELKDGNASTRVWVLVFSFTLAAGLLGTMARGFGWI
jgi:hypothetical protein